MNVNNRVKKGGRSEGALLEYLPSGTCLDKEQKQYWEDGQQPYNLTNCINALNKV